MIAKVPEYYLSDFIIIGKNKRERATNAVWYVRHENADIITIMMKN